MISKTSFLVWILILPLISFSQWQQLGQTFVGEYERIGLGHGIDLSADGTTVAVGTQGPSGTGIYDYTSYTEVYKYDSEDWIQVGERINGGEAFIANRMAPGAGFSVSLSSDGNILAVGEPNFYTVYEDILTPYVGRVRVYELINDQWQQIGEDIHGLPIASLQGGAATFGSRVKLSEDGNIIAIAGRWDDIMGTNSGQVQVYQNIEGQWQQMGVRFMVPRWNILGKV